MRTVKLVLFCFVMVSFMLNFYYLSWMRSLGTPIQNNLLEYFHMASWVRPGRLGDKSSFDRKFDQPIKLGMASDSTLEAMERQAKQSKELYDILSPFVHRRDNTELKKELPFMQQVVLHVRQTKLQTTLFRAFNRCRKSKRFLEAYQSLHPVINHPGTLFMRSHDQSKTKKTTQAPVLLENPSGQSQIQGETNQSNSSNSSSELPIDLISDSDEEVNEAYPLSQQLEGAGVLARKKVQGKTKGLKRSESPAFTINSEGSGPHEWWKRVVEKKGEEFMKKVENGYKLVLLLQIIAHADQVGDKVVIFSKCLKTLDFIEEVLKTQWESLGMVHGPWKKNSEYLRIDGELRKEIELARSRSLRLHVKILRLVLQSSPFSTHPSHF